MNRRDLLKFFSVGTVIAPLTSGVAQLDAAAELIEVPNVAAIHNLGVDQIIEGTALFDGYFPSNRYSGGVRVQDPMPVWVNNQRIDARVRVMEVEASVQSFDTTRHSDSMRPWLPSEGRKFLHITVELP